MDQKSILSKKAVKQYEKAMRDVFSSNPVAVGEKIANDLYWKNRQFVPIFKCFKDVYHQDLHIRSKYICPCKKCGAPLEANSWAVRDRIRHGKVRFCPRCDTPNKYYKDSAAYANYLESEDWLDKREEALLRAGDCCERCGRDNDLQVHHRTYLRLGDERPDDLVVLCRPCHKWLHKAGRVVRGYI